MICDNECLIARTQVRFPKFRLKTAGKNAISGPLTETGGELKKTADELSINSVVLG